MVKYPTTYFISNRWEDYSTIEFKEKYRPKDTRGLGFTEENWEKMTGKKGCNGSNISNKNVTIILNRSNFITYFDLGYHKANARL